MQFDAAALNGLIMQLPLGYRTVFNLYVVEGYDHREIATLLNINENTSRSQLMKAKNKLKTMVEQTTMNYENTGR
jgi:RNA polymerase sigma-70 factor (ECF subfamily)